MGTLILAALAGHVSSLTEKLWRHEESGQGLIEYALIIVLVSVAAVGALSTFGSAGNNLYLKIVSELPF